MKYWWNKNLYQDKQYRVLLKEPWITKVIWGFVFKAFKSIPQFPADIILISWRSIGRTIETERIYLENHDYAKKERTLSFPILPWKWAQTKVVPILPNMNDESLIELSWRFSWSNNTDVVELRNVIPLADSYLDSLTETLWNTVLSEA